MKKTINIHLGKQLFTIEEDAYESLQHYLKRLERSFANEEGVTDIMEDIEMRFAELLKEYLGPMSQVVTITEVKRAIESLGEPEEIQEEEPTTTQNQNKSNTTYDQGVNQKRMYRDTEIGMLGGVASGLAEYLSIDPVIVRAVFVVFLFLGFGFLLYIILWAIIPAAKTPSDRLQMQGKPVNIDTLKEEVEKAASRIKDDTNRAAQRFRDGSSHLSQQARNLIRLLSKIVGFGLISGAIIWIVLFSLVVSGVIDFIPTTGDQEFASLYEILQLVSPVDHSLTLIWTAILMVGFGGPIFAILLGSRMIMGRSNNYYKISLMVLSSVIGVGFFLGLIGGIKTARDYEVGEKTENQHLTFNSDQLIIQELPEIIDGHRVISTDGIDFIAIENKQLREHGINISYKESADSLFHVTHSYSARGVDRKSAKMRSGHIQHKLEIQGNKLLVDPYYSFPSSDGLRDQEVELIIEIPHGKDLIINGYTIKNPEHENNGVFYSNREFEPY